MQNKKIAILAWGSLYWNLGCLSLKNQNKKDEENWKADGVILPIEFSRISKNDRLTLVIDKENGTEINTYWALSKFETLDEAIENLRCRENSKYKKTIGYIDLIKNTRYSYKDNSSSFFERIKTWAIEKNVDAVIWTDLPSNFLKETKEIFCNDNAIKYLNSITDFCQKEEARKYIEKAPDNTQTEFRNFYTNMY